MTSEKEYKANELQDLDQDGFKLESLTARVEQIEATCQKMQVLELKLEREKELRWVLEEKMSQLHDELEDSKGKYHEVLGWVDDLEDKLRYEQQQQKMHARKVAELCEKLKALERECNQRYAQIAEEARERCEYLEKRVQDLELQDESHLTGEKDISALLGNRTMEEALLQAAAFGDTFTVHLLISHGVNVHQRQEDESSFDDPTALHLAAAAGHKNTVHALLEASAHVNARACISATPLICAARAGHIEVCQLLLKFGADVNSHDSKNMTALHYACSLGYWSLARLFIRNGANLSARANGKTPADIADANGYENLAKFIRSKIA